MNETISESIVMNANKSCVHLSGNRFVSKNLLANELPLLNQQVDYSGGFPSF